MDFAFDCGCDRHNGSVADVPFICHNAAFDLAVTQDVLRDRHDIYTMVDAGKVWIP